MIISSIEFEICLFPNNNKPKGEKKAKRMAVVV